LIADSHDREAYIEELLCTGADFDEGIPTDAKRRDELIQKTQLRGLLSLRPEEIVDILSHSALLRAIGEEIDRIPNETTEVLLAQLDPEEVGTVNALAKRLLKEPVGRLEVVAKPLSDESDQSSVDEVSETLSKLEREGHLVCRGENLRKLVREGWGLGPRRIIRDHADLASMKVLGMFDPAHPESIREQGPKTCLVVLWTLKPGVTQFPNGLNLDELVFLTIDGTTTWQFEGGEPVTLKARENSRGLLWISGAPSHGPGIPPFTVEVEGAEPVCGLATLYNLHKVPWTSRDRILIEVVTDHFWKASGIDDYWVSVSRHVHQMPVRSPFTVEVPLGVDVLDKLTPRHRPDYDHRQAVESGQLVDYSLPGWPLKRAFTDVEGLLPYRQGPMLDFGLFRLPSKGAKEGGPWLVPHKHCFEVIVPLQGAVRAVVANAFPWDREPMNLEEVKEEGRKPISSLLERAMVAGFPDLLLLNSSFYHGFTVDGTKDGFFLGIRCDDAHIPPRGTRKNSSQGSDYSADRKREGAGR
jgi:hypothetical protein